MKEFFSDPFCLVIFLIVAGSLIRVLIYLTGKKTPSRADKLGWG